MDAVKIQLSEEELQLVQNASVLLTKNSIIGKVYTIFGGLSDNWQQLLQDRNSLPLSVLSVAPKISKGENYKSLPYVMLDYPRLFGRSDVCAIRTFFWWGHFFSMTLQLKGDWHEHAINAILRDYDKLAAAEFYITVSLEEWQHDFEIHNKIPLKQLTKKACELILHEHPFCKLSTKIPLQQWSTVTKQLHTFFCLLIELLDDQLLPIR